MTDKTIDDYKNGETVLGLYDGEWIEIRWAETRKCMLAGIGGGNGYFGEGWEDVLNGLIVDEPERLKEVSKPQANKTIPEIWSVIDKYIDSDHLSDEAVDNISSVITKAITQAMLDALPEKLLAEAKSDWGRGFDEAIDQMETAIKKMGDK